MSTKPKPENKLDIVLKELEAIRKMIEHSGERTRQRINAAAFINPPWYKMVNWGQVFCTTVVGVPLWISGCSLAAIIVYGAYRLVTEIHP